MHREGNQFCRRNTLENLASTDLLGKSIIHDGGVPTQAKGSELFNSREAAFEPCHG